MRAEDGVHPLCSLPLAVLGAYKKTGRSSWQFDVVCGFLVSFVSTSALQKSCTWDRREQQPVWSGRLWSTIFPRWLIQSIYMPILMWCVCAADHISSNFAKNPPAQCAPLVSIFEDPKGLQNEIVECQLWGLHSLLKHWCLGILWYPKTPSLTLVT